VIPARPTQLLQYDRPLSPNEVRVERSPDEVRILIGPRTAWQVLASLDLSIYIMLAMALGCAVLAIAGLCYSHGSDDSIPNLIGWSVSLPIVAVCLAAAAVPGYRRRLSRTILTVSRTDVGIDPADDRSATIWVPRERVISVAMVPLRFRPFVRDAQTLQVGLTGAPPVIALSAYPRSVVQPIVDELIAIVALFARERTLKSVACGTAEPVRPPYLPWRGASSPYTPIEAASAGTSARRRVRVDHDGITTHLSAGPPTRRQLAAILWKPVAVLVALVCIDLYCLAAPALYRHMIKDDREFLAFAAATVGIMALLALGGLVLGYALAQKPLIVTVSALSVIVPRLGLRRGAIGVQRYQISQVCAGVRQPSGILGLNLPPRYVLMIRIDGIAWLHALPGGDRDTVIELAEHLCRALGPGPPRP
jgi:hypothetical protein